VIDGDFLRRHLLDGTDRSSPMATRVLALAGQTYSISSRQRPQGGRMPSSAAGALSKRRWLVSHASPGVWRTASLEGLGQAVDASSKALKHAWFYLRAQGKRTMKIHNRQSTSVHG
jgi:hypothetical protein